VFPRLKPPAIVTTLAAIVLSILLWRTAWAAEDAYIPFRVTDNFLHGYGLRWNIDERVQVFTDPLFLLMQTAATAIFGHLYLSTLGLSFLLTLAAVFLITRGAGALTIALVLAALVSSKGFMDYSMSGLENPATHLAIAAYLYFYWRKPDPLILSLMAALAATNRMDTALFFLPSLAWIYFRSGWKVWKRALIGWSPFLTWSLFSLFYYGFVFPNTAYAKLNTGIPERDAIWQGFLYYLDAWRYDTATLFVIGAGLLIACYARQWFLAAGVLLNLIYVVSVGGDYMISRFFTGAVIFSTGLLARYWRFRPAYTIAMAASFLAVSLTIPSPPITSAYSGFSAPWPLDYNLHVVDERAWGYPCSGFLQYLDRGRTPPVTHLARPTNAWWMSCSGPTFFDRSKPMFPEAALARVGLEFKRRGGVQTWGNIGMAGYYAGPAVHIVDPLALGDALIARLPMVHGVWAPGNYLRHVPEGYEETIRTGQNHIHDPHIAEYYNHLHLVISGKLLSWERLKEIYRFNTRYYDHLLPQAK